MDKPIVIKLGGSVITDKSRFKTPDLASIDALCALIGEFYAKGMPFIVVHGAGSYAHIPSKEYGLADGYQDEDGKVNYAKVHSLCEELSTLVVNALIKYKVPAVSFHPATFVMQRSKSPARIDDSFIKEYLNAGFVPVTHGDVVLDRDTNSSIISGDGLMEFFGRHYAKKLIFASDVDGLLTSVDGQGQLIPEVNRRNFRNVFEMVGGSNHTDVTGGMAGKIKNLMTLPVDTYIVNGRKPERIRSILEGRADIYTKFVP
ncbi:MAG: isopentenyl phosphate kinase [Candidatus Micrarchaeia archaeon]